MTPLPLVLLPIADVTGTGGASDVTAGAWMTLVLPLALLAVVLTWWWLAARRGWPKLPVARRQAPASQAPTTQPPTAQREPPRQDGAA
ncbi:MAG TPA: hypothetical protein VN635_05385 [Conexibacter sp.]|nr:hypothetical protein [Conexibacter sp.]